MFAGWVLPFAAAPAEAWVETVRGVPAGAEPLGAPGEGVACGGGVFDSTPGDRMVLIVTFLAVLFAEHLENALFIGIGTSIYYALRRAEGFKLRVLLEGEDGVLREDPDVDPADVGDVTVLNLQGELYFAAAEELSQWLQQIP